MLTPITDLDAYIATRTAWHTLAERLLAPARHAATGRIGLRPAPGGFATPEFEAPDVGPRTLTVSGTELIDQTAHGITRTPISTLGAAADAVGLDPAVETGVYTPTTTNRPTDPLGADPQSATILAEWFEFGGLVLAAWTARHANAAPSEAQLWPEHFDLALDLGPEGSRANYGASPGDASSELPYLYVGPWAASDDPFWSGGTYAALGYDDLVATADPMGRALDFFARGYVVTTQSPPADS